MSDTGEHSIADTALPELPPDGPGEPVLLVVTESGTRTERFRGRRTLLAGRSQAADIVVDDATVSKLHARVEIGARATVTDLGSTNGTFLHGERVAAQVPIEIQPGWGIRIGSALFMLQTETKDGRDLGSNVPGNDRSKAGATTASADPNASHSRPSGSNDPAESPAELSAEPSAESFVEHSPERSAEAAADADAAELTGATEASSHLTYSPAMQEVLRIARKAAQSDVTILILGETGVGKEVLASKIHAWSGRRSGPLQIVNCAGISDELLESELFGHEKGAFTDAKKTKPGLLELADGGSIFFDELGEMSTKMQLRLLRALETRQVTRVGATRARTFDARVIGATNRDLEQAVRDGTFRSDLFFRFGGFTFSIPPLRERLSEIPGLALHLLQASTKNAPDAPRKFSPQALDHLCAHHWPGNVRELRNVIQRAVVLAESETIQVGDLPLKVGYDPSPETPQPVSSVGRSGPLSSDSDTPPPDLSGDQALERAEMLAALGSTLWNVSAAARETGVSRRTFINKMKRYQIPGHPHRAPRKVDPQ